MPFKAGYRKPPSARTDALRMRLSLRKEEEVDEQTHLYWIPVKETSSQDLVPSIR